MINWPESLSNEQWISCSELRNFVDSHITSEVKQDRDRNKFWHEICQLCLVCEYLPGDVKIKYTGLTSKPFDAIFSVDDNEFVAECAILDDLSRYYQNELIEEITGDDGGWNPSRIIRADTFATKSNKWKIVGDSDQDTPLWIHSGNIQTVEFLARICIQTYEKFRSAASSGVIISWIILGTLELPFCFCQHADDFREDSLAQIKILSKISGMRIFVVGKDYVLDSDMRQP